MPRAIFVVSNSEHSWANVGNGWAIEGYRGQANRDRAARKPGNTGPLRAAAWRQESRAIVGGRESEDVT